MQSRAAVPKKEAVPKEKVWRVTSFDRGEKWNRPRGNDIFFIDEEWLLVLNVGLRSLNNRGVDRILIGYSGAVRQSDDRFLFAGFGNAIHVS